MMYQTFPNREGSSNSMGKLNALRLPDLKGKRFLDIGCNEGFFCIEAKKRGAIKVVGIDKNPDTIAEAKKRAPDLDFRAQDWENLPNEEFDVILLSSALHYAKNRQKLIDDIYSRLAPEGLFILECGVLDTQGDYVEINRGPNGLVYHPTLKFLKSKLLRKFTHRMVGSSVKQNGDPLERKVFHCHKYQPTALIISGKPGSGKTTFANEINPGEQKICSDGFMIKLSKTDPLYKDLDPKHIYEFCNEAINSELYVDLVEKIMKSLPENKRIIIFEGYAFHLEKIRNMLAEKLKSRGYYVWYSERIK